MALMGTIVQLHLTEGYLKNLMNWDCSDVAQGSHPMPLPMIPCLYVSQT
jgi:hypothetical protein